MQSCRSASPKSHAFAPENNATMEQPQTHISITSARVRSTAPHFFNPPSAACACTHALPFYPLRRERHRLAFLYLSHTPMRPFLRRRSPTWRHVRYSLIARARIIPRIRFSSRRPRAVWKSPLNYTSRLENWGPALPLEEF